MQKKLSIQFAGCQAVLWMLLGMMAFSNAYALDDPTKPPLEVMSMMPDADQTQAGVLVLSGVKDNGKNSFAIVNNTMVRMGDSYQGYRLIGVHGKQAIFVDQGRNKMTLSMDVVDYRKSSSVQTPPKGIKRKHSAVSK